MSVLYALCLCHQPSATPQLLRRLCGSNGIATKEEVKAIEKAIRAEVQEAMDFALSAAMPPDAELYTDIYDAEVCALSSHMYAPQSGLELAAALTPMH